MWNIAKEKKCDRGFPPSLFIIRNDIFRMLTVMHLSKLEFHYVVCSTAAHFMHRFWIS